MSYQEQFFKMLIDVPLIIMLWFMVVGGLYTAALIVLGIVGLVYDGYLTVRGRK